jgi:hypothetical protein
MEPSGESAEERERRGAVVVCRCLFEITRTFPELTPEVVWFERSRGQMMHLWRAAKRAANERKAETAFLTHAAVSTALANMWGKEVPAFQEMIEGLMSDDEPNPPRAAKVVDDNTLGNFGVVPVAADDRLHDLKEI